MNTISILNNQQISSISTNYKQNTKNNLVSNSISFGMSKPERALKLLDSTIDTLVNGSDFNIVNKMKFHRVLNEALPAIISPENYINKGRESKVYRISDKYVAKIKRGHYASDSVHVYNSVSLPNKKFKDLDFYYGEPVARVGKVEILKNATPTDNNIHCGITYHSSGAVSTNEMQKYETQFLPMCSEVSQENFDNLARNLKKLNTKTTRSLLGKKKTYIPDIINPNNLLISDGKFVLVDKLEKVPFKNPNSVFTMLEPLILRLNPERTASRNDELTGMRKNIFKKILIASEKYELPLDSPIKYEFDEWTLQDLIGKDEILSEIKTMREQGLSIDERIAVINSRLEK